MGQGSIPVLLPLVEDGPPTCGVSYLTPGPPRMSFYHYRLSLIIVSPLHTPRTLQEGGTF